MAHLLRYPARDLNAPLAANAEHLFAANYALAIYDSGAIYSFIPKNGCSTMRLSLAIANGCIASPEQGNWIHSNNATFRACLRELQTATFKFTILRDPFRRLASCFLDKIVSKEAPAWNFHRLCGRTTSPDSLTFSQFVHALPRFPTGDEHWRPQIDFLVYDDYDAYYALESFDYAIADLKKRIGLNVVDARKLTAHGLDQVRLVPSDDHSCEELQVHQLLQMKLNGELPAPETLYSPTTIEQVRRLYAQDIKLYTSKTGLPTLY